MTKVEWLEKNGFNTENELTWCIGGGDTYEIKNELKEMGFKFNPLLKWHINEPVDVPTGYGMVSFSFDELFYWEDKRGTALIKTTAESLIEARAKELETPSLSEYMGYIGERLRNLEAIFISGHGFNSKYGWSNIYTFKYGENELKWFSQKDLDFEKNQKILLTGTVKDHSEYKGVKATILSRCIVKERC